jgi:hypothetical protein
MSFKDRLGLWGEHGSAKAEKRVEPKLRIEEAGELDGLRSSDADACIAFPVPPEALEDGGSTLAHLLARLMHKGAGNGRYGGRIVLMFPTRNDVGKPPWGRHDVEKVCREALEMWPGLLDVLVWEDHPDLTAAVPDEGERLRLYGRLAFVALAESEAVWKEGERDMSINRELLAEWRSKAREGLM